MKKFMTMFALLVAIAATSNDDILVPDDGDEDDATDATGQVVWWG